MLRYYLLNGEPFFKETHNDKLEDAQDRASARQTNVAAARCA
jgi:hypothetical protein